MITFLFVLFASCTVLFAFFLRNRYSGEGLKLRHKMICLCYNIIFCFSYLELAKYYCVSFYGCFPDLENEHPAIIWISLFCFLLHAAAHPMEWTPRFRWRFRKSR